MKAGTTQTRPSDAEKTSRALSGRDGRGRFRAGASGNPNGRKPLTPDQRAVHELCVLERPANVARLVHLRDHSADEEVQLEAIKIMLSYSDGKPVTAHVGGPLVNVNVGLAPPGGRPLSPEECYRYVISGTLPRDEELALIAQLEEAARRPAIEHEPVAVETSAKSEGA